MSNTLTNCRRALARWRKWCANVSDKVAAGMLLLLLSPLITPIRPTAMPPTNPDLENHPQGRAVPLPDYTMPGESGSGPRVAMGLTDYGRFTDGLLTQTQVAEFSPIADNYMRRRSPRLRP